MKQTQNLFVRRTDPWTFYCHLCKKYGDDSHLATKAHGDAVELSATISWMCGGIPRILRAPHQGAPASSNICQQMRKAWWGPRLDNTRAQALKIFANLDTVTFHTKTKSYVIPKSELVLGTLWMVPYDAESGNSTSPKRASKRLPWSGTPRRLASHYLRRECGRRPPMRRRTHCAGSAQIAWARPRTVPWPSAHTARVRLLPMASPLDQEGMATEGHR